MPASAQVPYPEPDTPGKPLESIKTIGEGLQLLKADSASPKIMAAATEWLCPLLEPQKNCFSKEYCL